MRNDLIVVLLKTTSLFFFFYTFLNYEAEYYAWVVVGTLAESFDNSMQPRVLRRPGTAPFCKFLIVSSIQKEGVATRSF